MELMTEGSETAPARPRHSHLESSQDKIRSLQKDRCPSHRTQAGGTSGATNCKQNYNSQ